MTKLWCLLFHSFIAHLFIHIFCSVHGITITDKTHPQLNNYELLHYNDFSHKILKRSAIYHNPDDENFDRKISFRAMNRDFNLLLQNNKNLFSPDFRAFTTDRLGIKKPLFVDFNEFYDGIVDGVNDSQVSAHIEPNGLMTASIRTDNNIYIIEPSWRHMMDTNYSSMIFYKTSDIKHSLNSEIANSGHKNVSYCDFIKIDDDLKDDLNVIDYNNVRRKRQLSQSVMSFHEENEEFAPTGTHCSIYLVADYLFFQSMGGSDEKKTINYLIHIIDRVNKIFNNTEWKDEENQKGFSGMGFWIKEILIHKEATPAINHYNSDRSHWQVRNLLEAFSRNMENSHFCLAHLFTHRTFDQSVLGLAYVASPRPTSIGGICSPSYRKESNDITLYLNTGLTTTKNAFDQPIITREAVLVTTHEFGHNWGSEHDPHTEECSPSSEKGGSFIMYTYSVSGYDDNNKIFSPCSKRSIRAVLVQKSRACFLRPDKSYCGNFRVEDGEECDEGIISKEDYRYGKCCDNKCKLVSGADCSSNSPCCNSNCRLIVAGKLCQDSDPNNCKQESFCTGDSDKCPAAQHQADGSDCLDRGKCLNGQCISYCQSLGLRSCMCDTNLNACFRCCLRNNSVCSPVFPRDLLKDGTPCIYGFCEKGRCEKSVQDFVERFWDVIEDIDINTFVIFVKDNIVGFVIIISLIIWVPIGCVINYYDKINKRELRQRYRSVSNGSERTLRLNRRRFSTRRSRSSYRDNINEWLVAQRQWNVRPVYYPPT